MADVLDRLKSATDGHAGAGGEGDAVDGVPARWVTRPGSTDQTAAVMRACAEADLTVVPRGAGTKLSWGMPPRRVDVLLDTTRMDALVEHAAGDLVVVVGAGRRLSDVQSDLAGAGQWLAVDPPRDGTVGGTVATAATGPARLAHGAVRDLLIGVTMVRADGVVARSGGKVVKNVAGYDVGKLLTGSLGTLAVLTQAAFRLHPRAPARRWVTVPASTPRGAHELLQSVVHSQMVPTAVELDRPADGSGQLSVLLEGVAPGVEQRTASMLGLLGPDATASDEAPGWWGREPFGPGDVELRLTHEIGALGRLLEVVEAAQDDTGLGLHLRGSVAVGSVLAGVDQGAEPATVARLVAAIRGRAARFGGTVVVRDAPRQVKEALDVWGPVSGLGLMRSVKHRFDAESRLAPGRFVGGI